MELILDVGNTRIKYAIFSEAHLINKGYCSDNELEDVLNSIDGHIKKCLISSVKPIAKTLENFLNKKSLEVYYLSSELKMPFTNDYETPKTVGSDRLALVAGGLLLFPKKDVLIIDIGTCMTFDFISKEAVYLGGAISPGVQMRLKALHNFTGKLPLIKLKEPLDLIGKSTSESILSGVVNGMRMEINGIIDAYKLRYPEVKTILTGGDMAFFDKKLKNSIFAEADILFKGMHFILDQNTYENN